MHIYAWCPIRGTLCILNTMHINHEHIIINDYNVDTAYDTYHHDTVICLVLIRHNRVRANITYNRYLTGIPYPVSLIRYLVSGICATLPVVFDHSMGLRNMFTFHDKLISDFYFAFFFSVMSHCLTGLRLRSVRGNVR
jgi:hypothetical protein